MNEELKKMLDSINAKKQEVKDLCKAGKIEDAATAKEELKKLQAQFDLVYDLDVTKTEENKLVRDIMTNGVNENIFNSFNKK